MGDQKKVVFMRRFGVDETLHIHRFSTGRACFQGGPELMRIDITAETEEHPGAGLAVEDVITLVLREVLAEIVPDVFGAGMALYREVASGEGIQEIEANRELVAEA